MIKNCTEFLETMELRESICISKHCVLELLELMYSILAKILFKR